MGKWAKIYFEVFKIIKEDTTINYNSAHLPICKFAH